MSARTVSEWLRACTPEFLADLLVARPDLGVPVPNDFQSLAARASTPPSARRAMEELNAFELEVLEAVTAAMLINSPSDVQSLAEDLGVTTKETQAALETLTRLLLIWGDPLRTVSGAIVALPFGQPIREIAGNAIAAKFEPQILDRLLPDLPDDELSALRSLRGHPIGGVRSLPRGTPGTPTDIPEEDLPATERLYARGLLARHGSTTLQLPAEVGAALRRMDKLAPAFARPALLEGKPLKVKDVDSTAALEAIERVRQLAEILESWGANAPAVLRTGGLGVRDLKAAAKTADVEETVAVLLIEVAAVAGLIGPSDDFDPTWRPTPSFDAWRAQPPAVRWVGLAQAWLDGDRLISQVGRKDAAGKSTNPLAQGVENAGIRSARRSALEALAAAAPGTPGSIDDVTRVLEWRMPLRHSRFGDDLVRDSLLEAAILGVTGRSALTTYSRLLLAGAEVSEIADALGQSMPAEVSHIVIQADLSALAPGPLTPELHHELALLADLESPGAASLWRFSEASLRRAFDSGRAAHEVQEFLARISSTPVPQTLTYLVDDVARRHGTLRVGGAGAYLRSDDATLLTEVVSSSKTQSLGLRLLAPTVAITQAAGPRVLEVLRAAGYSPAAEAADGAVVIGRSDVLRSPVPRRSPRSTSRGISKADAELAVAKLQRNDSASQAGSGLGGKVGERLADRSSAATLGFLQQALEAKKQVWIGFVGRDGISRDGLYTPVFIGGGRVLANDGRTDQVLPLHLITGVAPVEEGGTS